MSINKIIGTMILILLGGIILFTFMLFTTVKTKSTSLDQYEPYRGWVGRTVTLDKETVLFKEKVRNGDHNYPYTLMDHLHPSWPHFQEVKNKKPPYIEIEEVAVLSVGTMIKLEKAVQYTGGVSGYSTPMIFGTIHYEGQTYRVCYYWGQEDHTKRYDQIDERWYFNQAPWQNIHDTAYYALPKAIW